MKPLWRSPSWGTVEAGPSRLAVVILMLLSPVIIVPLLVIFPYLVTLSAAWAKRPRRTWRLAVIVSVALAIAMAALGSPLMAPAGLPLPLPAEGLAGGEPMPGLTAGVIALNAILTAGVAILPVAFASTAHTVWKGRQTETGG